MRPIFTIHAGEYLVASHIEKKFKEYSVWVPSKDSGVDLLILNDKNKKSIKLQVKFSKDFSTTHLPKSLVGKVKASGWWSLNKQKIKNSKADYWVLLVMGMFNNNIEYIIISPSELLNRLQSLHGNSGILQSYFTITNDKRCYESRGMLLKNREDIVKGENVLKERDFTDCLNNWDEIKEKLK